MILVSKHTSKRERRKVEMRTRLKHENLHGKVLADTVAGASRERIESEILDGREG